MKLTCVTAVLNAIKSGNRENLIRCVRSVAALKTEHEHLIYDGASVDGTVDLLRELEKTTPGLKVVSEPDTGIYNALNKGVHDARGEWFYVLGCDDYICNPIEMVRLIDGIALNIDMAVAPVLYNGRIRAHELQKAFITYMYCHQGVLIRTKIVRRLDGFDESFQICSDGDMLLKIHTGGCNVSYTAQPFAVFSAGGLNEKQYDIMRVEILRILQKAFRISDKGMSFFGKYRIHKFEVFWPYVNSPDQALRRSARYMLRLWIWHYLRYVLLPLLVVSRPLRRRLGFLGTDLKKWLK